MTDAPTGSALARLRDRRKAAAEKLHLDLPVPRIDPPVYVRFRPVEQKELEQIEKRFRSLKHEDRNVIRNAAVLAEACVAIFEKDADGEEVGIDPDNPDVRHRFDEALTEVLGEDAGTAADAVRALYLTDGDVISTSVRVTEWSGFTAFEDDPGN